MSVMPEQKNQINDFAVLPFNRSFIKDRNLVSNMLGGWAFLDNKEFSLLNSLRLEKNTSLFRRLYERGLIVDEQNLGELVNDYRKLNSHLFHDTSLHIAVITTRCNLKCRYCQTSSRSASDMTKEVAARVLKYLFDVRSHCVTLEFQGGEPLLNWEVLVFLIEHARRFNTTGKHLRLALVSNLTLLDEEKMKFLTDFNVDICASWDGPRQVHDKNRIFRSGKGSYDIALKKIKILKNKFGKRVSLLPTITRSSFKYFKEIIDEYVEREQSVIALRPVNKLGNACIHWMEVGYSAEEFIEFYKNSLDYILGLNKKGVFIRDMVASLMLEKILNRNDPSFVDFESPCGAGRGQIVYMPDGSCYPCDESRMLGEEIFKLGSILNEDYQDLVKKENLLHLLESSLINLWDYNSAFSPWMGTCPVINYASQKNFVPKIRCSSTHKIYTFQFTYIFEKILESEENLNIFKNWVRKEVNNESKKG